MRIEKVQIASFVTSLVNESSYLFLISYKGMNVAEFSDLRNRLHALNAICHVLKNSYIRIGLEQNNITIPAYYKGNGDTALVAGTGDPCPTAKALKDFGKNVQFVTFKAGVVEGIMLSAEDAALLAQLPSKDVLRSQLLGVLQAPMRNLAGVLDAKVASIVYLLNAYLDKKEKSS